MALPPISLQAASAALDSLQDESMRITKGKIETIIRAKQATAGETLAELLMEDAIKLFRDRKDDAAKVMRDASDFCLSWAKNERECQARLEKLHGRYDG